MVTQCFATRDLDEIYYTHQVHHLVKMGICFKRRVIRYWNKLPIEVKEASSVNNFKIKLEHYKLDSICEGNISAYWELSQEIFRRL